MTLAEYVFEQYNKVNSETNDPMENCISRDGEIDTMLYIKAHSGLAVLCQLQDLAQQLRYGFITEIGDTKLLANVLPKP